MNDRWRRAEIVFHEALEHSPDSRLAFVRRTCSKDPELAHEVESLLEFETQHTAQMRAAAQTVAADLLQTESPLDLEDYRIIRKLGSGGMSTVYLAEDLRLRRNVALKVLQHEWLESPEGRLRLRREARTAAGLTHPNIAAIYGIGESSGMPWIAMEYVEGVSLRSRMLSGAMPQTVLHHIAGQITAALEHAHSRGVIHRDIKPENVIVTREGTVKLLDFGLALIAGDQSRTNQITVAGMFLGTLRYAAPEVIAGAVATKASDVYSLGALLFELATGEALFAGLTGAALIAAILSRDRPHATDLNPALPPRMAALIDRCLARTETDRFRDACEVAAAIRTLDSTEALESPAAPSVAVVDFRNLVGDPDIEWLGAGIAETVVTDLAKLATVRVANRAAVQAEYRRAAIDPDDTARMSRFALDLHVRWLVCGSFQRMNGRVRVLPRLIEAGTGEVVAIGKIDGAWDDLFDIQDRVVTALLDALAVRAGTTERERIQVPQTIDLTAYELYSRGRAKLWDMGHRTLAEAIALLDRAVALDPRYALAWSALGTAYALSFLRSTNPDELTRASACLENAIVLDPEIGDPYPWLCFVRTRRQDVEGALEAGRKAVQSHPDLALGHYFYGGAAHMFAERRKPDYDLALHHLSEAIRLQPNLHSAYFLCGETALMAGLHQLALNVLSRAVELEKQDDLLFRFVGARSLLAVARLRCGDLNGAETSASESITSLRGSDHVYCGPFTTLAYCTLGDIGLRRDDAGGALNEFRNAWRVVQESARMIGRERLLVKTMAGMAAAYAATGDHTRAAEIASDASGMMTTVRGNLYANTFECCYSHLSLALAVADARLGSYGQAARRVLDAAEAGWGDRKWVITDPEYQAVRDHPDFQRAVAMMHQTAPIPPDQPRLDTAHAS